MSNLEKMYKHTTGADVTHYQWLDLFRFACAFLVVIGHARGFLFDDYASINANDKNIWTAAFFGVTRLGHEAVIAFFVLSGYFVGGKALAKLASGAFNKNDYALDRISRIFLPLFPIVFFTALVSELNDGIFFVVGNILGFQGWAIPVLTANGPLWSLAYEIWFYVLVYVLADILIKKKVGVFSIFSVIFVAWVFSCLKFQYLVCWIIGALFYFKTVSFKMYHCYLLVVVGVAGLQYTSPSMALASSGAEAHHLIRPLLEIVLSVGFAMLCVVLQGLKSNYISRISVGFAAFSYTLYLVHYPVLYALSKVGLGRSNEINLAASINYFFSIVVCLIVAWFFYFVFERNTTALRSYLKKVFLSGDLKKI